MRRLTLVVLVLAVGGLLWLRSRREEKVRERGTVAIEAPLLPGLDVKRVRTVHVEQIQRDFDLTAERDRYGAWQLTEPVAYPAESTLFASLLGYLRDATGPPVHDPDAAELGLAPPRVVLTLGEELEDGTTRDWRVEIGKVDLDARRVYARVSGGEAPVGSGARVLRVVRSLATTLDRNPDDYRDTRACTIPAGRVVELVRKERPAQGAEGPDPVDSDLAQVAGAWRRMDAPSVALDPGAVGLLVRVAAELRAKAFVQDQPSAISAWGLDDPRLSVEVVDREGRRDVLRFSTSPDERDVPLEDARWYAMRDGFPHVWAVRADDVRVLLTSTEHFYDYHLLRAQREDVLGVELVRGKEKLSITRVKDGWSLTTSGGGAASASRPADAGAVEDLLAALSNQELGDYAPPEAFRSAAPPERVVIRTGSAGTLAGELGLAWHDPATGAEGRLLRRDGDAIAAIAPPALVAALGRTEGELESKVVHAVEEHDVDVVRVRHGDREHVFRRKEHTWSVGDGRTAASAEQEVLLERLLRLDAARWLDPGAPAAGDPVTVRFEGRQALTFTLGLLPDGSVEIDEGGRRAVLVPDPLQQDVHAALVASFEDEPAGDAGDR